jgi:hypothetical protein
MQRPVLEADCRLANQETAHIVWNPEVCCRVHKFSARPLRSPTARRNLAQLISIVTISLLSPTPSNLFFFFKFFINIMLREVIPLF